MKRIAAIVCSALILMAGVANGAHAESQPAIERFTACVAGHGAGDMVLLFDESASLQKSDPGAGRVVAGRYLVQRLASFAERLDVELNIMAAGFGTAYRDYGAQWLPVTGNGASRLLAQVDEFAARDTDTGTDYWLGLDGARKALGARDTGKDTPCRAIFFFSDGELDVSLSPQEREKGEANPRRPYAPDNKLDSRDAEKQATTDAAASLCRDGGVADQIRLQDIVVFGVGLRGEGSPDSMFSLMKGVVTGATDDGRCGSIQQPVPGDFTTATDIDGLLFAFDSVTRNKPVVETVICQGTECPEGTHQFVLDASVQRLELLGSADVDAISVRLAGPNGAKLELERKAIGTEFAVDLAGAKATYTWLSERSFTMTMDAVDVNAWTGVWTVTFVDPKSASGGKHARTSIYVAGDLRPRWIRQDSDLFRSGESYPLTFDMVRHDGAVVDPATILGSAVLDVSLVDDAGESTALGPLDAATMANGLTLDTGQLDPGPQTLRLRLAVTTAAAKTPSGATIPGTELTPQVVDLPFTIEPPLGYPTVGESVQFGHAEGPPSLGANLAVTGPGCVWLKQDSVQVQAAPDGVDDVSVTSAANASDTCVRVDEGAEGSLPLEFTAKSSGNGAVHGMLTVVMTPLEGGDEQMGTVRFSAELTKDLNTTAFATTLGLALLLGPGIPLLILYLLKFLLASKIPGEPLNATLMPISVRNGDVFRDGAPLAWQPADARDFFSIARGGVRRLSVGDTELVAKLGLSPFGAGQVQVIAPGRAGVSSYRSKPKGKEHRAMLPLAIQDNWVLLACPGEGEEAQLLVITAGSASQADRERLLEDARRKVPAALAELQATTAEASAPGRDDPRPAPDTPAPNTEIDSGEPEWDPFAN